ncbi:hypothetical protein D3C86_1079280 [compost metagenome]
MLGTPPHTERTYKSYDVPAANPLFIRLSILVFVDVPEPVGIPAPTSRTTYSHEFAKLPTLSQDTETLSVVRSSSVNVAGGAQVAKLNSKVKHTLASESNVVDITIIYVCPASTYKLEIYLGTFVSVVFNPAIQLTPTSAQSS